jgi:hypothetical protein
MSKVLFEELSKKIEKIIECYDSVKKDNIEKENQILIKDEERLEIKKQLDLLIKERDTIKRSLDKLVEKIDSTGLL